MGALSLLERGARIGAAAVLMFAAGCGDRGPRVEPLADSPAGGTPASADPSLAVDAASGDVLLTWIGGDSTAWHLFFARSADGGATWSAPVRITADTGEVKPHGEASPRLVAGPGGRLAVVWVRDVPVATRKWPASAIRVSRSLDGGRSWLGPVTINDDTTAAPVGHNFQGAAWAGDSGLVAAWLDERTGAEPVAHHHDRAATAHDPSSEADATIYLAVSPDFGRSWRANQPTWGGACPCCRITLARRADGGVVAAWRQHFPGNVRDVVTATVAPEPRAPQRVHEDAWEYPGCPHNGPGVSVGADGRRHVVWYTGAPGRGGLYYAVVGGAAARGPVPLVTGKRLPSVHGSVAALADGGAIAAFDAGPDGARAISVAELRDGEGGARIGKVPGSAGGTYPQIAATSASTAVVAWTARGDGLTELRLARVALSEARH